MYEVICPWAYYLATHNPLISSVEDYLDKSTRVHHDMRPACLKYAFSMPVFIPISLACVSVSPTPAIGGLVKTDHGRTLRFILFFFLCIILLITTASSLFAAWANIALPMTSPIA